MIVQKSNSHGINSARRLTKPNLLE